MRLRAHILLSLAAALLAIPVLGAIGIYGINLASRRNEEAVLRKVATLRIGTTTLQDCQPILDAYAPIVKSPVVTGTQTEQLYVISVFNHLLNRAVGHPLLWSLGLRPSAATVKLRFNDEKLTYLNYTVNTISTRRAHGNTAEVAATVQFKDEISHSNLNYYVGYGGHPSSFVPGAVEFGVGSIVTPRAANEERNAALDFDLSCISSFRGCRAPCQLLPAVWKEVKRRSLNRELDLPQEVLEDIECSPR
jgi:hypothetical protein